MLRGLIGDTQFFEAVRTYFKRYQHGIALTSDFQRAIEETTGRDMGWFFHQWVSRPGFPRFRVQSRWDAASREVEVRVSQTQDEAWPVFRTPLTLELSAAGNSPLRRVIDIDEREETLRIPYAGPSVNIAVDPDGWVLKELVESDPRP